MILHYFSTLFGSLVCWVFFFPSLVLMCRHFYYFGRAETTFQKRGEAHIDMCFSDTWMKSYREEEGAGLLEKKVRRKRAGCCSNYWGNCNEMCCRRRVATQEDLFAELKDQE
mmetsp:Transcript_18384/g.31425  ORF Transcript_18384/g.31425 Transcript_18384/m.31425 type:complete len:112 (+) Transcript_18384:1772-2107(+)